MFHHGGKPGQELNQDWNQDAGAEEEPMEVELMEKHCLQAWLPPHMLFSLLCYRQAHLPRAGTAQSALGLLPLTSIK